jgi:prepilin-type N-terminal cleavage/methylation domain-containing protein
MKKKGHVCRQAGFSLVELLVVVAVILVLTGIGSYSISKFTNTSKLVKLGDYLSSQIKLARNLAITNQIPSGLTDLSYVQVSILNNKVTVEAFNNAGVGTTNSPYFTRGLDIDNGMAVTITNDLNVVNSFGFSNTNGRLTDGNGAMSSGPVVIKLTSGSEKYSLTIYELGIIDEDE